MEPLIRIKPHHFIDILTYYGAGTLRLTPHPYGHAFHAMAGRITSTPCILLEIELGADDICQPCVHNIGGICDDTIDTSFQPSAPSRKQEYNLLIDERWCAHLGLTQGERLSAAEFCERLTGRVDVLLQIYREMPAASTTERERNLKAGIARFLALACKPL